MIEFSLPINPPKCTSQTKRICVVAGRPMFFKKAAAKSAEHDLMLLCAPMAPSEPLAGPLALRVEFTYPWRKSEPRRIVALKRVPHTTKPDCDNIVKMVSDVLTKLRFYGDDSQIARLVVEKYWGDAVGISIRIESL